MLFDILLYPFLLWLKSGTPTFLILNKNFRKRIASNEEEQYVYASDCFYCVKCHLYFLTSFTLYVAGELLFFYFRGIPVNFTIDNVFIICQISLGVGSFVGVVMWWARLLKIKGF